MKNPKPSGKGGGAPRKPPSAAAATTSYKVTSSSANSGAPTAAAAASPADRKSRWESPGKSSSDSKPPPKPERDEPSRKPPSSASPAAKPRGNHPPPPHRPPVVVGPRPSPPAGPSRAHPLPPPFPVPHPDPAALLPPPPSPYGFHNLDRRTIVLADGSVRSYFTLPPDPPPHINRFSPDNFREPPYVRGGPHPLPPDYWPSGHGPHRPPPPAPLEAVGKRKYSEEDELARFRKQVQQYGGDSSTTTTNSIGLATARERDEYRASKQLKIGGEGYEAELHSRRIRPGDAHAPPGTMNVDRQALKRAFLKFAKLINESMNQRKNYLENGRIGPLQCIACGRATKEYPDMHGLIMHTHNYSQSADLHVEHLGLHKALCVLMGWNYSIAPDSSNKSYQALSQEEAQANREDLILWPPTVILHNTNFGRKKDGRIEGFSNRDVESKLKELGFPGGKAKSLYGREGHTGVTIVKFADTVSGLKEAERLANFFDKENHGRRGWARAEPTLSSGDHDKNPLLVRKDERTGEKKQIFYGYLATASDLDIVDVDTIKRASIMSRRDFDLSR